MKLQRLTISPHQIHQSVIGLTTEQRHYLYRVLRLKAGDRFIVMDGQQHWWIAQLIDPHQGQILEPLQIQNELPIAITLWIALPKGNGFDDIVRQTTELGASCLVPIISTRTLLNPSDRKLERWQRIAQEAAEQSERQLVPTISEPQSFQTLLTIGQGSEDDSSKDGKSAQNYSENYICVTQPQAPHLLTCLLANEEDSANRPPALTIAIGPEGGWTVDEENLAYSAGFQPVSLGKRILRTVTAPIATLSLIAATLERNKDDTQLYGHH